MIPYGRQNIDDDDIQAVIEVLKSDFITTGPKIDEFEKVIADYCQAKHVVAVSNGTAALHTAVHAAGIGKGDEVIVTPMSFAASANCIVYVGATPVFADVLPDSLLIDPQEVEKKITKKTKAVIAVDFAGQTCAYDQLQAITDKHNLILIEDAAHSIGGAYKQKPVGSIADLTTFSFHPVKHITTGEGGAIACQNDDFAQRMRHFRNHGITTDFRQRQEKGAWFYQMEDLGFNYRLTDIQCALGLSQIKKLKGWVKKRQEIAGLYDKAFSGSPKITPLYNDPDNSNAYHLYVVKLNGLDRNQAFNTLREKGIGVNVHYIPIHLQPYYKNNFGTAEGMCPVAEGAFEQILSLPMFPGLTTNELDFIIKNVSSL